jgi:hypothetical protein
MRWSASYLSARETYTNEFSVSPCTDHSSQASNHNVGPSYPQGLSVVSPAPQVLQGLWVVATNNKEDVVVTKVPWAALLTELA